jgi:dTDP-4-amino-4,6-dideoxygalactose transaminase
MPADVLPFIDLQAQRRRLGAPLEESILRVVRGGQYIMGPEIAELEEALKRFCGAPYALTCASGTDALALILMLKNVRPGQAILCPAFTFAATAEVVAWLGAKPVFVDVDYETFNVTVEALDKGLAAASRAGLNTVGIIPVDLFGLSADYATILPWAKAHGLWTLADCAQSFGAHYNGRRAGAIGDYAATSFFPAKPLGCYGDGGAIFFHDPADLEPLISFRVHGQGADRYDNVRIGMNGRMDTLQAAILLHKLAVFEEEIEMRNAVAARYAQALGDVAAVPRTPPGSVSSWAQYTIRVPASRRAAIAEALRARGVPTAIYYPRPLHRQTAYKSYPVADGGLPICERLAGEVLSLPMHPYLLPADQDRVVAALRDALGAPV